jgi:hypothetical protein
MSRSTTEKSSVLHPIENTSVYIGDGRAKINRDWKHKCLYWRRQSQTRAVVLFHKISKDRQLQSTRARSPWQLRPENLRCSDLQQATILFRVEEGPRHAGIVVRIWSTLRIWAVWKKIPGEDSIGGILELLRSGRARHVVGARVLDLLPTGAAIDTKTLLMWLKHLSSLDRRSTVGDARSKP